MSFLDLATLAVHRQSELEERIRVLVRKCDQAQSHINFLKVKARGLVGQLNCESKELKDRFLKCMKQLDEYIYLVTDINLSFSNIETEKQPECTPVKDAPCKQDDILKPHLLDILSEPVPSTSTACQKKSQSAEKKKFKKKHEKKHQELIEFSSSSCSRESVQGPDPHEEASTPPAQELEQLNLDDEFPGPNEEWNLPAQAALSLDAEYHGCIIMHVDGSSLWLILEGAAELNRLIVDMNEFYKTRGAPLSAQSLPGLTYCAYLDEEQPSYYRSLILQPTEDNPEVLDVFLVDTGETTTAPLSLLRPLAKRFYEKPSYARLCHLTAVDIIEDEGSDSLVRFEKFLKDYIGQQCDVIIDDNSSESLGVFLTLPNNEMLNQLAVKSGLAKPTETPLLAVSQNSGSLSEPSGSHIPEPAQTLSPRKGPPEIMDDIDLDISDCPEHEDPVEAVTGYHNRDEVDICKHYKGGPARKCFKGDRCKKRHVVKHPDGWSLDRVPAVVGHGPPLPAPGSSFKGLVTCVEHFDCVWLQITDDHVQEPKQASGKVLPFATYEAMIRAMNSSASHRPFKELTPHPGELVAALYPPDGRWYRAVVLSPEDFEQVIEVQFVDYGNKMPIKNSNVRQLDMSYTLLPYQAVRCRLAGIKERSFEPEQWAKAKHELENMVLDKHVTALVIERGFDELVVELLDDQENSYGARLAEKGLVNIGPFAVVYDNASVRRIINP